MKGRILVADDDASVLKMTKLRLEHEGYEVVAAGDGEEVLRVVSANGPIDLILLDLRMPKLDGLQVCQRLKADPETSPIPIMLFTASEGFLERVADLCIELGAADWIKKPFRSQELLEKIRKILKKTGQQTDESRRTRILVVDDDRAIHEIFAQALSPAGFEVVAVESGKEAIAAVQSASYAVAFLDIVMPGMDGLEVLKALLAAQPQLRVVMMTGQAVEDMCSLALHFGAVDCLYKPFEDTNHILQVVQRFSK
jgi:CheY-like chemotaxis protein